MGIENFDAPYHKATYVGETNSSWTNGVEYTIHVTKMSDGRYQCFKSLHHYKELPGHKVYNNLEEINKLFTYATN